MIRGELIVKVSTCRDEIISAVRTITQQKGDNCFTIGEILDFLKQRNSIYSESTIRTHITSKLCANAPDHHSVVYDDLERIGRGKYKLLI